MKTRRKSSKLLSGLVSLVVLLGVCFGWGGSVGAATTDAIVTIEGKPLSITKVPIASSMEKIILDGETTKETLATLSELEVTDPSGTGEGWILSFQASQFTTKEPNPITTLQEGSLNLETPSIAAKYDDPSAAPTVSGNFDPLNAIDGKPICNFIIANDGQGLGKWGISWDGLEDALKLTLLPKQITPPGIYTSTITWTLISNPD